MPATVKSIGLGAALLIGLTLLGGAPARAQQDPMLAGAAFAASDLSPLKGVTMLRFIPGRGLVRYGLGESPPALPQRSPPETRAEAAPVSATPQEPIPLFARQGPTGSLSTMIAALVSPSTVQLKAPRWYVYAGAGSHMVGYSFIHSGLNGWTSSGVSVERALVQSEAQLGIALQQGDNAALLGIWHSKDKLLVSSLPSLTEDRVYLTFLHEMK